MRAKSSKQRCPALCIIYSVAKFHQYLHGRIFKLIFDQKPLVSMFSPSKKPSYFDHSKVTAICRHPHGIPVRD